MQTSPPPFPCTEDAWFWTAAMLEARRRPHAPSPPPGPCRPEVIVKCLDELYRHRRVELVHAHVLRVYGRRGRAPDPRRPAERSDLRLWAEAMAGLDPKLRRRGIVAGMAMPRRAE